MQTTLLSLIVLALAHQTFAGVFITNPTATTTAQGGQALTINWKDDGSLPTLPDIGPCEIGLYAGNMQQQTELQAIAPSVDVSKETSQDFNVNATLGPNFNSYFIRVTSLSLKDSNNPQFPYEAFSAKFTLSGMSGQFNPLVQAQINGVTSASSPAATPATSAASSAAPASSGITTAKASTTTNAPAKSVATSSDAPKPTQSNAALITRGSAGIFTVIGVIAAWGGLLL